MGNAQTTKATGLIDITGCDLREFVKDCYELSSPVGVGFLHYKDGPLDDETAQRIVDAGRDGQHYAVSMDYVKGRSVKMDVRRINGRLCIDRPWFRHTEEQLEQIVGKHATA